MPECPSCHSTNILFLFNSHDLHGHYHLSNELFKMYHCLDCLVAFPLLKKSQVNNYYSKYYHDSYYQKDNILVDFLASLSFRIRHNIILSKINKNGKINILDIGSGDSKFLNYLDSSKYIKNSIDINPLSRANDQINHLTGDYLKYEFSSKQRFDVLTCFHVLEHLSNPSLFFKISSKLLRQRGLLLLTTPNTSSLGYRLGKSNWFHLDAPRHLALFNQTNLVNLASQYNFKLIQSINSFYEYPLDLYWSLKCSKSKYLVYPLYPFFKLFDQETLFFIFQKN